MRTATYSGREVESALRLYGRVTDDSIPYLPRDRREREDLYLVHDTLNHLDRVRATPLSGFVESDFDRMCRELRISMPTAKLLHSRIYLSPLAKGLRGRAKRGRLIVSVGGAWRTIDPGKPASGFGAGTHSPARDRRPFGYRLPSSISVEDLEVGLDVVGDAVDRLMDMLGPPPRRTGHEWTSRGMASGGAT